MVGSGCVGETRMAYNQTRMLGGQTRMVAPTNPQAQPAEIGWFCESSAADEGDGLAHRVRSSVVGERSLKICSTLILALSVA